MADEKKNLKDNAGGIPDNIDELLENAGKSLAELSEEVGQEKKQQDNIELEDNSKVSDVDSILSSLAAELENIGDEIEEETPASVEPEAAVNKEVPQPEVKPAGSAVSDIEPEETVTENAVSEEVEAISEQQPVSETDQVNASAKELLDDNDDDPLAELAAELEAINGGSLKDLGNDIAAGEEPASDAKAAVPEPAKPAPAVAKPQASEENESVDDILARLAQEISQDELGDSDSQPVAASKSADNQQEVNKPVESGEAVEKHEDVDSLGTNAENVDADDEIAKMSADVQKAMDDFEAAAEESDSESETTDDDLARQLDDLTETLSEAQDDKMAEDIGKAVEASAPDEPEPSVEDVKKAMPHAEEVLDALDRQMKDLNDLVSQETNAGGAADGETSTDENMVMQELEDKTAPAAKGKKDKKVTKEKGKPDAELQSEPAIRPRTG
ncbi:MAG: hypothetical protein JXM68_02705, partial [Sedimentisphaerales bacterium]|nr:hypothetical protein [Sedimentisphaerales bacterium]